MKTFDLTFNGSVLPSHDPEKVRQAIAQLFAIDDSGLLDQVFSGDTVVLRGDLDRKAAADFYQQITRLGARAELVVSDERLANHDDALLRLDTGEPETAALQEPATPDAIVLPPLDRSGGDEYRELKQLRSLIDKTQQQAEQEERRLQHTLEKFDDIAEQELARLAELGATAEQAERDRHQQLDSQEMAEREAAKQALLDLNEEQEDAGIELQETLTRLANRQRRVREQEQQGCEQLRRSIEEKKAGLAQDIERLEQLICDAKAQYELDVEELEAQVEDTRAQAATEIEQLDTEKADARARQAEHLEEIESQRREAREAPQRLPQEFAERHESARRDKQQELARLETLAADISEKRKEGMQRAQASMEQVLQTRDEALAQFHARERELLEALGVAEELEKETNSAGG